MSWRINGMNSLLTTQPACKRLFLPINIETFQEIKWGFYNFQLCEQTGDDCGPYGFWGGHKQFAGRYAWRSRDHLRKIELLRMKIYIFPNG